MKRSIRRMVISLTVLLAAGFAPFANAAVDRAAIDTRVQSTLDAFYAQNPNNRALLAKASGVLVFPKVTKAGLGVGGEHGHGALLVNGHTVGYYKMSGASVGATVGVASRSEIILFMTHEARENFEHSTGWTIGADVGVAVATKGAGGDYDTETMKKPVIAFVLGEHGLMGDVSLAGTKVSKLED